MENPVLTILTEKKPSVIPVCTEFCIGEVLSAIGAYYESGGNERHRWGGEVKLKTSCEVLKYSGRLTIIEVTI